MTAISGLAFQRGEDAFELDLGQQFQLARIELQPVRAQRHLVGRLLAAHVHGLARCAHLRQRLQQQRGFAHARIAADQHHLPRDQSAAQHPVEFPYAGRQPLRLARADLRETLQCRGFRDAGVAVLRRRLGNALDQRVPCAAVRALALPLGRLAAAFGAGVDGLCFGHLRIRRSYFRPEPSPIRIFAESVSTTGTRGASAHSNS